MWIGDDLLDKPTDYTFDRGNIDTGKNHTYRFYKICFRGASETVQIGNGSILAGLEKAILCMTQGSQHFVILSPEWGYGKWGNLPQIPGNATLVFQVYVRFVSYEIEDRFVRMPMRLRQQIPLRVIITTCHRLKYEAKKTFEKTSDVKKQVNRNTGEETYKKSGKNNGDFFRLLGKMDSNNAYLFLVYLPFYPENYAVRANLNTSEAPNSINLVIKDTVQIFEQYI